MSHVERGQGIDQRAAHRPAGRAGSHQSTRHVGRDSDPRDPAASRALCAPLSIPRGYYSAAILLVDGSVLIGGDRPGAWTPARAFHR